jgi:hypothetical protein
MRLKLWPQKPPKTCLECGFLTISGREVTQAGRIELGMLRKSASMPANSETTNCYRNLWVGYDLTYIGNSLGGVFEEINADRNKCPGIFRYESSYSPAEHLKLQEQSRLQKFQLKIALLPFLGGVIGAILGSLLHDTIRVLRHWITARF